MKKIPKRLFIVTLSASLALNPIGIYASGNTDIPKESVSNDQTSDTQETTAPTPDETKETQQAIQAMEVYKTTEKIKDSIEQYIAEYQLPISSYEAIIELKVHSTN